MNRNELLTRLAMQLAEWPSAGVFHGHKFIGEKVITPDAVLPVDDSDVICTRKEWLAERERLINKPSWDEAPARANWLFQDSAGDWWWHEYRERSKGYSEMAKEGINPAGHAWEMTLEQRPNSQADAIRECEQRLTDARLTDDIRQATPADLLNRQLIRRCEDLEEANATLVEENIQLRRLVGGMAA